MNNKVIYNIIIALLMISIIFLYFQVNRAKSKTENFVSQLSSALLKTQMHSYILLNKKINFDSIETFGKENTKNRIENPLIPQSFL
jgi:predicted Holliday junction resolvase-like endonuclease